MAKKLTAGVLQGTAYRETMRIEWQGEEFEVDIRPLSNKETSEIEALMKEGVIVRAKPGIKGRMERVIDFNSVANTKARYDADIKTVAFGTVDEAITEEVVEKEFPPKLVKEIAKRIRQITGIDDEIDEVEDFNEGVGEPSNANSEQ